MTDDCGRRSLSHLQKSQASKAQIGPIGGTIQTRTKNNSEDAAKPAVTIGSATLATLIAPRCHARVQPLGQLPRGHRAHMSTGTRASPNAATQ